jgi:hypothetical protein
MALKENHDLYTKSTNAEKADSLPGVHNALGNFIIAVELTSSTVESRQLCAVHLRGSMFILTLSGGYQSDKCSRPSQNFSSFSSG